MLSQMQTRKLTRLFTVIDADGNGAVEHRDYQRVAENLARAHGREPGSPGHATLVASYDGLWANLQQMADTNRDGKVSIEEYLGAYEALLVTREPLLRITGAIRAMLDTDGDGQISEAEYVSVLVAYGVSEADAQEAFRRLDSDQDGKMTIDELRACVEEFFYSDDPEARGNWLVGPLDA